MFERFTDSARRVVVLAQEEARMLGHHYVGSEHLLLGLLHEQGGVAARALGAAGITAEAARAELAGVAGRDEEPATGRIPFTPRSKKVLELSLREALEQGKRFIGTEHVLLALLREADGLGARILERLGGPLPALRQRVLEVARESASEPAAEWEGGPEAGVQRLLPPHEPAREARAQPQAVIEFRRLLTSVDRRLANIERRLGIAADEGASGGIRRLRTSVERRLGNIERHLGLPGEPPGAAGEPPAPAG